MLDLGPILHIVISTVGAVSGVSMSGQTGMVFVFFSAFVGSYVLQTVFSGINSALKGIKFAFPSMVLSVVAGVGAVLAIEFLTGTSMYFVIGMTEILYLLLNGESAGASYMY